MGTKLIYLDDEGWSWRGPLSPCLLGQPTAPVVGLLWPGRPTSESSSAVHHWAICDLEHHQPGGKGVVSEPNSCPAAAQTQVSHRSWATFRRIFACWSTWTWMGFRAYAAAPESKILFPVNGFQAPLIPTWNSSPHPSRSQPEQAWPDCVTGRSDGWAKGCMAMELPRRL